MSKENEEEMGSIQDSLDEFLKQEAREEDSLIIRELLEPQFEYFFFDWCVLEKSFELLDRKKWNKFF